MLSLTTTNKVTFNVNVFGTAATPTVRCIIGEAPGFSFPATKLDGGQYEVLIDLPKDLKAGPYQFKVEVLLNGRLFTPINHSVPVTGVEPAVEVPELPAPNAVPDPTADVQPEAPAPKAVVVIAPAVAPSLMSKVTAQPKVTEKAEPAKTMAKAPPLSGLAKLANTLVFSKKKPAQEVKQPKISMADVSAAAEKIERPTAKPSPKKMVESITPTVPVSLIKGAVIYR